MCAVDEKPLASIEMAILHQPPLQAELEEQSYDNSTHIVTQSSAKGFIVNSQTHIFIQSSSES